MRSFVLCVMLLAACSACRTPRAEAGEPKPTPSASSAPANSGDLRTGTPAPRSISGDARDEAFIIRPSGIRCMAAPCPYFLVTPEAKQDLEPLQIHELKWERTHASEAQVTRWVQTVNTTELRVKGKVERRTKAGPAGDAMVLNIVSVDR